MFFSFQYFMNNAILVTDMYIYFFSCLFIGNAKVFLHKHMCNCEYHKMLHLAKCKELNISKTSF